MAVPHQLDPPLPVIVPEKNLAGWAHLVWWQSLEHSLYWTIALDDGRVWTVPNEKIRFGPNWTAERPTPEFKWPSVEALAEHLRAIAKGKAPLGKIRKLKRARKMRSARPR